MDIVEWYVGFHRRASFYQSWKDRNWSFFGHVEAWGYTTDKTWIFMDPRSEGTTIRITHHYDDITDLMAERYDRCWSILRTPPVNAAICFPFHPTMNCVSQCAHLLGIRAYTPQGLHRILLKSSAKELINATKNTTRRS